MACGGCDDIASQHRFTLESPAGTPGPSGHVDLSNPSNWTLVSNQLWGRFVADAGREANVAQRTAGSRTHSIEFDWNSLLAGATTRQRLRIGSRVFNITGVYDVLEARQTIRIDVTEPER